MEAAPVALRQRRSAERHFQLSQDIYVVLLRHRPSSGSKSSEAPLHRRVHTGLFSRRRRRRGGGAVCASVVRGQSLGLLCGGPDLRAHSSPRSPAAAPRLIVSLHRLLLCAGSRPFLPLKVSALASTTVGSTAARDVGAAAATEVKGSRGI